MVNGIDREGGSTARERLETAADTDPLGLASEANRRLRGAIVATVSAIVLLSVTTPLSFWDVIGIPVFYLLLPGLALAQLPLLRASRIERIPIYVGSAVTILAIGGLALWLVVRLEGARPAFLDPIPGRDLLVWTALLTAVGVATLGSLTLLDRRVMGGELSTLLELLPRGGRERLVFAGLSLCAGVGEELAYRGYALSAVQLLGVGPWAAAGISAAAFGLLHCYQGWLGTARTAVTGFLLTLPLLMAGTILPAILAHILIDLAGGLVIGPRLIRSSALVPAEEKE